MQNTKGGEKYSLAYQFKFQPVKLIYILAFALQNMGKEKLNITFFQTNKEKSNYKEKNCHIKIYSEVKIN